MSVSQRKDGRWIVKYRSDGKWKQRSFRAEQEAVAFDLEQSQTKFDENITMGELLMIFARMEKAHQRFQENMATMLEAYRSDTQNILREVGDKHEEVARFYRNNVELVRNYERMTDALQTLVVNNTRAVERLITIVETRHKQ